MHALREKTTSDVLIVLAMVVAWYANISDRPGEVICPGASALCAGRTIQSIGGASSLPYRRVPCHGLQIFFWRRAFYTGASTTHDYSASYALDLEASDDSRLGALCPLHGM